MKLVALVVLFLVTKPGWAVTDYSDCAENVATLENALYSNGKNIVEMNRVFFPPASSPPRLALVDYQFLDENNEIGDCNVTYAWATSTFLIFLPPVIFQWASLNFFVPDGVLGRLRIVLPYECRSLINSSLSNENCTCVVEDHVLLDMLTQQISVYAKYNNRGSITRERTNARSHCSEDIEISFYDRNVNGIVITLAFSSILLPVFCTLLALSSFRNLDESFTKNLVKPENHAWLVAAVMTGLAITIAIYIHDVVASYHVINSVDFYEHEISSNTPHFAFVHVTLAFDTIFLVSLLFIWIYIIYCVGSQKKFRFDSKLSNVIGLVVGKKNMDYLRKLSDNDIIAFTVFYMLIPPIFMSVSHLAYLVAAWLVEPHRGTVILLISYAFVFYLYKAFKKVYEVHLNVTFSTRPKFLSEETEGETNKQHQMISLAPLPNSNEDAKITDLATPNESKAKDDSSKTIKDETSSKKSSFRICGRLYINYGQETEYLNVQMFALTLVYGVFIVIFGGMALSVFVLIPSASDSILTYVLNIFHILVILVTAQLSFQIFFAVNFSIENFMEVLRDRLSMKKETKANETVISVAKSEADTTEVAGTLLADIADAIINKYKEE